ncbi:MAG TPA: PilZ domain-containing protein [Tepidisphaeraceae bacterium]|jgi:hypothetical protein
MSLSYDQRSEIRWAFEEAYVEPERRRACRVKHKVPAKLAFWKGKPKLVAPLDVTIEDFSTTGVGLVHSSPLKINECYLLEVPRGDRSPMWVVLRVVRCLPMDDGNYAVGLEAAELLDASGFDINPFAPDFPTNQPSTGAKMNRRLKILFLLFGIAGTAVAAFMH